MTCRDTSTLNLNQLRLKIKHAFTGTHTASKGIRGLGLNLYEFVLLTMREESRSSLPVRNIALNLDNNNRSQWLDGDVSLPYQMYL